MNIFNKKENLPFVYNAAKKEFQTGKFSKRFVSLNKIDILKMIIGRSYVKILI